MDKWLLSGASLLLILECLFFLGDPILGNLGIFEANSKSTSTTIGKITYSFHNVKQKNHDSLVWQDSPADTPLYAYDSVLTLKNSSAKLKLQGDIQLDVRQNTLVVLEPPKADTDKNLLLRFSRGNLRGRTKNQSFRMGHGEWSFEATPGTDVSLRSLGEDNVEVEVAKGEVKLNHPELSSQSVKAGEKLNIEDNAPREIERLNTSLKWSSGDQIKVYAYEFPAHVQLQWEGAADSLLIEDENRKIRQHSVAKRGFSTQLNEGSYWLRLENEAGYSPQLSVQVLKAPHYIYLSPLPRDRYVRANPVEFFWMRSTQIHNYRLEISGDPEFKQIKTSITSPLPGVTTRFANEGDYYWRVIGLDPDGFEVPSPYVYPIYPVEKPLSAPQLIYPTSPRQPAAKDRSSSFNLWNLLFPKVYADELKRKIIFSWYPVPEADFYLIEISSAPDFLKPETIIKTKETRIAWSEFEFKTYYFRVAGGQNNGRKGLFSEPMKVDLTNLPHLKAGEIQPGVEYAVEEKVKAESTSKSEVKAEKKLDTKVGKDGIDEGEKKSAPLAILQVAKGEEPKGKPQDLEYQVSFYLGSSYLYSKSQGPDYSSHVQNFSQAFASMHLNFPIKKKGSIQLKASYSPLVWKPKNSSPFQKEQSEDLLKAAFAYRFFNSSWSLGAGYQTWGYLIRQGPESLSLEKRSIVSAHVAANTSIGESWQSLHEINLAYWNDDELLQINNQFNYLWAHRKLSVGPRIDLGYLKTIHEVTRFQYELGFTLGVHF